VTSPIRFGAFEVDTRSGELRRQGSRLKLQEQPFQVLVLLLEHPGEVVTREELTKKLWRDNTFVDFDRGLNKAINRLREVLRDSAEKPRFIETLPQRGYRFIAPVQIDGQASSALPSSPSALSKPEGAKPFDVELHPELEVPVPRRGLTRGLFILIQCMYLVFYLVALFRWQDVHRIADGFLAGWGAMMIVTTVLVTGAIGIPLRCYLISGAAFDHRRLGEKFSRLFPAILALDELWAVAPFLLMEKIGFGAAFAATAGLLYLPFSERSLVRMAYPQLRK